jgi:hypothetical protein
MKIVPKENFSYYLREILLYNLKEKTGYFFYLYFLYAS